MIITNNTYQNITNLEMDNNTYEACIFSNISIDDIKDTV